MNEHNIYIPQDALDTTIQACSQELRHTFIKQSDSYMGTLQRFLIMDLRLYMKLALIGLCLMITLHILLAKSYALPFIIYFAMLGCMNIYEIYKTQRFQMEELCMPVYLNAGRVFLFKNASLACFELSLCIFFVILDTYVMNVQVISIMLSGILPLLCIQIFLLYISKYVRHLFVSFSIYIILFMVYSSLYYTFEHYVLAHFDFVSAVSICVFAFLLLLAEIWYMSIRRKEEHHGIEITTY